MSVKIADAYISVTTDQAGFDGALRGLLGSTSAWSVAVGTLVADALKGVANLVIDAGKAMVGFLTDSIDKAATFEQGMADVKAVMTISTEEMEKLSKLALNLGMSKDLVVTATEATGVIKELGAAGVSTQEMLDGTAEATIKLANATGGDLGTASKVVTMLLTIFGIEAKDLGGKIDSVTGVINESKMTLMDYKYALGQGGPALASFGIALEDVNASLAATNGGYTSGQTQGTAYRTMILRMIPTTVKAKDMMVELGLATKDAGVMTEEASAAMDALEAELAALDPAADGYEKKAAAIAKKQQELAEGTSVVNNHFFDQQGEFIGLEAAGNLLQEKLGHLSTEEKNLALNVLFGVRGMQAASLLMESSGPVYDDMYNRVNNLTDATASAADRNKTLGGSWEILQGIMEAIQIQMGMPMLDALQRLNLAMGSVLEGGAEPLIDVFVRLGGKLSELIDTAIIPFVEAYGPSFIEIIVRMVDQISSMLPTPERLREILKNLGDTVIQVAGNFLQFVETTYLWVNQMIAAKDQATGFIGQIMAFVQPILDVVFQFVTWKDVLAAFIVVAGLIVAPLLLIIAKITAIIVAVAAVRTAWETDWAGMRTHLTAAFENITEAIQSFSDLLGLETVDWAQFIKDFTKNVEESFENLFITIENVTGFIAALMRGDWEAAWKYAATAVEENMQKTSDSITKHSDFLKAEMERKAPQIGRALPDGINQGIESGMPATEQAVKSYGQRVIDNFKGIFGISSPSTVFAGFGRDITAGLAQGLSDIGALLSAARDMANRLIAEVKASFAIDWSGIGGSIIDGIKGGISGGVQSITDAAKAAAQSAVDAAKAALETGSPSKKAAREIGLPFAQGVGIGAMSGLSGIKDKIQTGIGNMMPDMRSVLGGGGGVDMSGIEAAIGGISGKLGGGGIVINQNYYIQGSNTAGVTDAAYNGTKKALRQVGLR